MARILEALRRTDQARSQSTNLLPPPRPFRPDSEGALEEEIPFIEVGGPRALVDASPSVLAAAGPATKEDRPGTSPKMCATASSTPPSPLPPCPTLAGVAFQPVP